MKTIPKNTPSQRPYIAYHPGGGTILHTFCTKKPSSTSIQRAQIFYKVRKKQAGGVAHRIGFTVALAEAFESAKHQIVPSKQLITPFGYALIFKINSICVGSFRLPVKFNY